MVKKMDNYVERTNDDRFKKYDESIMPNNSEKRVTIILTTGITILLILLGSSLYTDMGKPLTPKFDYGLNISYSPQSSIYYIEYTNPNETSSKMDVDIQVPFASTDKPTYVTIYKTSTSTFPTNISFKPYDKNLEHIISVAIIKPSGNYTYFYVNNPGEDDKVYNGLTKYIDDTTKYIGDFNS